MPPPKDLDEARFFRGSEADAHNTPMLQVFRAYCLGMLKACGYVNDRIRYEHYYEVSLLTLVTIVSLMNFL